MGFEIVFHYHERNEEGKYDTESRKSFTKSIGRKSAEVSLEQVAAVVLGQLARRDMWIVDVEIFEFAKRSVVYKETKNGVVIKNKKFSYDQIAGELTSEDVQEQQPQIQQSQLNVSNVIKPATPPPSDAPLRHETFRPSKEDYAVLMKRGFKFTFGRPYPIFEERVRGERQPISYVVVDDTGNKTEISSMFFEPLRKGLVGIGNQENPYLSEPQPTLSYMGGTGMSGIGDQAVGGMPVLRRR